MDQKGNKENEEEKKDIFIFITFVFNRTEFIILPQAVEKRKKFENTWLKPLPIILEIEAFQVLSLGLEWT